MSYLKWQEKTLTDLSSSSIEAAYAQGYLFTRLGKGMLTQTRSLRLALTRFELTSENKRILRKTAGLTLKVRILPLSDYSWSLGKLAHDFYEQKFGRKTFSVNKMKEILTDSQKSNFNRLLSYDFTYETSPLTLLRGEPDTETIGYCITMETDDILHYAYPFYNPSASITDLGLGMMLSAVVWAKEKDKKYIYLGSCQRPADKYKLQFKGLEWFDGQGWRDDLAALKSLLAGIDRPQDPGAKAC